MPFVHGSHSTRQRTATPTLNQQVVTVEQSILDNIKQNGFDSNTTINNGLGGLWINWRYGTSPLQTNFNGSGVPDGPGVIPPRHDVLTDLRYLHTLWLYKAQHPTDTQYDSEVARYTPIVKAEFANTNDERGWLFDEEFMDLYQLSQDTFYQNAALSLANGYAKAIDPNVGIMYKTSSTHPQGYYRTDNVLEAGCALIQAGTLFGNAQWIQQGQTIVSFVYSHAYIAQYHTFAQQMDQVLTPGRTVNPSETFYIDHYRNYTILGNTMRPESISQIILSLLHSYQVTGTADFLQKALDLLNPLSLPANSLSMWDTTYLGYYYAVAFNGMTAQQPGTFTVDSTKKEAGTQITMLWAFHLADTLTNNMYASMESQMLTVALDKTYYATGHGVLYEMRPDWSLVTIKGIPEDWVTTEAMGAELEGLFTQQ